MSGCKSVTRTVMVAGKPVCFRRDVTAKTWHAQQLPQGALTLACTGGEWEANLYREDRRTQAWGRTMAVAATNALQDAGLPHTL